MSRQFYTGSQSISDSISLSNVYQAMRGGFGNGITQITSFMTSTTVEHLKKDLITFETLLKGSKWPVSKVIQREVDQSRVKEISKNYIDNSSDQIRYFPPIVVAILPRKGDLFSDNYTRYENNEYSQLGYKKLINQIPLSLNDDERNKLLENESSKVSLAEGLFINKPYEENLNFLAWDKNKYYAIVIDGQHRFEALKMSSDLSPSSPVNNYYQDVIFIDASAKYFSTNDSITSISIFRKIFMDINKNPVLVSESKQIIMDDTDPAKLFVQAIVDDNETNPYFIKPELIDWNTNSNKHELPYLTSVLNLYSIISDKLLSGKALDSLQARKDENNVKKWASRLNDFLKVDHVIENGGTTGIKTLRDSLDDYIAEKNIDDDALFNYDIRVLDVAISQFKENYLRSFVYFFNNLFIYKKLIEHLESKNIFSPSSDLRLALLKSPSNRYNSEDRDVKTLKHQVESSDLINYFSILFTVVGQKALFDLYFTHLSDQRAGILNDDHLYSLTTKYINNQNEIFEYLSNMNFKLFGENNQEEYKKFTKKNYKELKDYEGISTYFWDDLLYFDKNIKYNKIGVNAIKNIFRYVSECIENRNDINSVSPIELNEYENKTCSRLQDDYSLPANKAKMIAQKFVDLKLNFIKHVIMNS